MMPLVFLHGWAQSRQVWFQQADIFPDAIFLNLPGHGDADDMPAARWIESIIAQLPDEPCVLAGWSLGGILAQHIASQLPDRIKALALISTTPCFRQRADWQAGCDAAQFAAFESAIASASSRQLNRFFALMLHGDALERSDYNRLAKAAVDRQQPASPQGLSAGLELLGRLDQRKTTPLLTMPSLIIHGEQDAIVSVDAGRWLADSIPANQFKLFQHCGHAPFLTQPERFNTILSHWWKTL